MTTKTRIYALLLAAAFTVSAGAQQVRLVSGPPPQAAASAPTDQEVASTQEQLLKLLRTSPTLTTVVAHDPSLLSDQAYVARNNPELAQFITTHPDIARNPEFYLFTRLPSNEHHRDQALERAVWPDLVPENHDPRTNFDRMSGDFAGVLAFACFLGALIWIIRQVIEGRRWSRIFKLQSEVHARLIEKFGSTQEIAAYMETEAGKRFLEAAPIPMDFDTGQRMPNAVARVLTPLQIGIVMVLLGIGFLALRGVGHDMNIPMLVLGTIALMPGIGFILSAGITWVLAGRLGLMPAQNGNPQERQ